MHDIPITWLLQLQEAYPLRSGPSGWNGMKMMLAVRRALMDHTWETIIDGCQRYKAYAKASGREGTEFVLKPQKFIEDGCFLEEYAYKAPQDPKIIEARQQEQARWDIARSAARDLPEALTPYPLESIGSFETRIEIARTRTRSDERVVSPIQSDDRSVSNRIADLTQRLRLAK